MTLEHAMIHTRILLDYTLDRRENPTHYPVTLGMIREGKKSKWMNEDDPHIEITGTNPLFVSVTITI